MAQYESPSCGGYSPDHPWYYVLGGVPLTPAQIRYCAIESGYQGYCIERIEKIDRMAEPQRSGALRKMKAEFERTLVGDLQGYREYISSLQAHKAALTEPNKRSCKSIHTAVSLKHNHLYNDFAILNQLKIRLDQQRDLFDS